MPAAPISTLSYQFNPLCYIVAGKQHRLREAGMWFDAPEYYNPPSGVVTYLPDVPDRLVYPLGGMTTV